ncbi:TonB-dependent hemoglobin/transferrin/lactoferrin family receptor [Alcaligenaceae bacterium LF4-65]|uniref:TonB-dependent hemoglobin/transferrin/lactoferrin family receptor n=1 Tax=Zwartia hollandica TaxID=324606 RepID=A0A953NBF2_9BURK|nr:TonB-dependent hemoglobin/transferrin/lactoferrin family receptor [Zwartia hollandica]MBZ1352000.1 TonB-dependent hemoglobin/transferrin/lactoferrin family receptor [Zwartia hollandica]
MLSKTRVSLYCLTLGIHLPRLVLADPSTSTTVSHSRLEEVTVSATRSPRRVHDVSASVTVIGAQQIEQEGARDIKDLFRNELDVSVRAAPTRFGLGGNASGRAGNEGINIRGLGGNQVLMLVDGIRIPNGFNFGAFATGRGDFLDIDGLKSVEVLRGPASTQYGSDGLAGAVSFRTLDPSDLLKTKAVAAFSRMSYASIDHSGAGTLAVAGERTAWQGMVLASYRLGRETATHGIDGSENAMRTQANPANYRNRYLLGKAVHSLSAAQQLSLTVESQYRTQAIEVYSARALRPTSPRATLNFDTRDQIQRDRVSLEHRFSDMNASWIQSAETKVYWQDAFVNQFTQEERVRSAVRTRDNTYRTRLVGLTSQFETNLSGVVSQKLTYGFDWSQAQVSGLRDGTLPPYGEVFPVKPFPDSRYTQSGVFGQSEMEFGALSVIPGLRFDYYQIAPSTNAYKGNSPQISQGQAVTPRLGAVWRWLPNFSPYGQVARGFRAPTPEQVNNGFSNIAAGYTSVGNAELKPEYADSIELGVRGSMQGLRYSIAGFDNRYKNFISQQRVGGIGRPSNPYVYQYVNLTTARIRGVVISTESKIDERWSLQAGIAYLKGTSEVNGRQQPLDSVDPLKAVLGVRYDVGQWGARANVTYSAPKSAGDIAESAEKAFAPGASAVLDLGWFWKPTRDLTLNVNINNALDAKYWRWSDMRGLEDTSPVKDAYTAAGRNIQLSLRYDY